MPSLDLPAELWLISRRIKDALKHVIRGALAAAEFVGRFDCAGVRRRRSRQAAWQALGSFDPASSPDTLYVHTIKHPAE